MNIAKIIFRAFCPSRETDRAIAPQAIHTPQSWAVEDMEGRTMLSAVVFVGGWGSSVYQYSTPAPTLQVAPSTATLRV